MLHPKRQKFIANLKHSRDLLKYHSTSKKDLCSSLKSIKHNLSLFNIDPLLSISNYHTPVRYNSIKNRFTDCKLNSSVQTIVTDNKPTHCDASVGCCDDVIKHKNTFKMPTRNFSKESDMFSNYIAKLQRKSLASESKHMNKSINVILPKTPIRRCEDYNETHVIYRHKSLQGNIKLLGPNRLPHIKKYKIRYNK